MIHQWQQNYSAFPHSAKGAINVINHIIIITKGLTDSKTTIQENIKILKNREQH